MPGIRIHFHNRWARMNRCALKYESMAMTISFSNSFYLWFLAFLVYLLFTDADLKLKKYSLSSGQ